MTLPIPNAPQPRDPLARDRLELEWLELIRDGDEAAFEALFRAYVEPLCAFAFSYVQSQHAAQEVVQALFCRLWERRASLGVPRSVHAYLYGAARNGAINYLRGQRVERAFLARALHTDAARTARRSAPAEEEVDANALAEAVERLVEEMPRRCREVFTLTRDQHLTYAETAAALGISTKTVEIHMGRALAFLRRRLRPWITGQSAD